MSHRSKTYPLRPNDDGITYRSRGLVIAGLIGADVTGWTVYGAFINETTNVRTYDNLTGTIHSFDGATGAFDVSFISPTAPISVAKYRVEFTFVDPAGKKITAPSPGQNQTFVDIRATG